MRKTLLSKFLIALCLTLGISLMVCSCSIIEDIFHFHTFVDGVCECGDTDPNYVPSEPEKETYTVTVVDEDGAPLAGATVQLSAGDTDTTLVTNENGVATFELTVADYTVTVSLAEYCGEDEYTFAANSTALTVQLSKIIPADGTVAEFPLYPEFNENLTAKVTVPAGATYYFAAYGLSADTTLTANGEVVEVTYGFMRMPSTFTLTNSTAADVEYTLVVSYVLGSANNPAALELGYGCVEMAAGSEGYYLTWTAPATGFFSFEMYSENWFYVINNLTTYAYGDSQWSDSDPVVNPTVLFVNEGDVLEILVNTYDPENMWSAPAGDVEFNAAFGGDSAENPFLVNFTWNDEWTEASAKVTVPAGTTLYVGQYRIGGMLLSINGDEPTLLESAGFFAPTAFALTNDTEQEAEYTLTISYPVGTMSNPELLEDLSLYNGELSQAEGNSEGYFYTWTAPSNGSLVLYFAYEGFPEGYECDIVVTNMNTYEQLSLLEDGIDHFGLELVVNVSEGDVLVICIAAVKDAEENYYPAADMEWYAVFSYPEGSIENPINIEWSWDDDYTNATATVTLPAGETLYFNGNAGMILTVNGEVIEMTADGDFAITNDTEEEAEYALALATPVGAYNNPELIEDPTDFTASGSLQESESYCYIFTATEDTTLVFTITEGANVTVDVLTYVDGEDWPISEQFALAEPEMDDNWCYVSWIVADDLTIEVQAGQEVKIQIEGLTDFSTWTTPAIEYTLTIVESAE